MHGSDPRESLENLAERAGRLVARARTYLEDVGDDPTDEGVEPVRMALTKLEEIVSEGTRSALAALSSAPIVPSRIASVETILEVTRALGPLAEEDSLLELIMDLVVRHSKAERGFLLLRDGEGGFAIRAARDFDQETIPDAERELSRTIVDRVLGSGEPLLLPNAVGDASLKLKESVAALRILSVLCVPIRMGGDVHGVVYLESRSVRDLFDEDDLAFVRAFSDQAAVSLENARLFEESRRAERRLEEENVRLKSEARERHAWSGIIGRSRPMQELYALLERVSPKPVSVLIRGENGTGKELVARVLHYNGPRADGPFVTVNCAALPETLVESELFGIEKGTATGVEERPGKFEVADGGTLFLDEVGDMSLVVQAKLLRVLQEREIERVGARRAVPVDVRVIAATNVDLEKATKEKRFREDLYYRLNVVPVVLPPLRERVEDIPLLVRHFLDRLRPELSASAASLSPAALERLSRFAWPGNVRQLENVLAHALVLARGDVVELGDLPGEVRSESQADAGDERDGSRRTLEAIERAAIVAALVRHGWVQTEAATELGVTERGLRYKLGKLGIERPPGRRTRGGGSGARA